MAYEQPVLYELGRLAAPTLLICGDRDRTALGRNRVSAALREQFGHYTELAPRAAAAMPHGKLVMLEGVGHIPHLETPTRFHELLLEFLAH
jgi:pimeloyl-ACP methyl ester carboxylesterase